MKSSNDRLEIIDRRKKITTSLGLGIGLGVALGAGLGNIAVGLALGILIGGLGSLYRIKKS